MSESDKPNEGELILYQTQKGAVRIEVLYESDTFWLNPKKIAERFGVDLRTISYHLGEIYASGELSQEATLQKIRRVQQEGNREVSREIEFYNLDAIISVGYRVNSTQATQFRIWATQTLREFVVKGFVLDDERLKLNKRFGKDYFDELLRRESGGTADPDANDRLGGQVGRLSEVQRIRCSYQRRDCLRRSGQAIGGGAACHVTHPARPAV
jgi:hypothetical protein